MPILKIQDLHVAVEGKEIIKGLSMTFEPGKVHALMGPNGSGKSTLANTLLGHPKYTVTKGKILYGSTDITSMKPDERSRLGLFLSFQYPHEIAGVTLSNFLRTALNARRTDGTKMKPSEFVALLQEKMRILGMEKSYLARSINQGFSGGEKKRCEILQLLLLNPTCAILDETDSGLDIDALRVVSEGVNVFRNPEKIVIVITHYKRILDYLKPDKLSILVQGKIALEGDGMLVDQLEQKGYGWIDQEKPGKD